METVTHLQLRRERDAVPNQADHKEQTFSSDRDKFRKHDSKQVAKYPKSSKRSTLPSTKSSSLAAPNPIYANLDPLLSENLRNFSLPRVRQLWCADPSCPYNIYLCGDTDHRVQKPSKVSSTMALQQLQYVDETIGQDGFPPHNHERLKRQEFYRDTYDESEIEESRRSQKVKPKPDFSPATSNCASNSTASTGLSIKHKRCELDVTAIPGQFNHSNSDHHCSFKSTNARTLGSNNGHSQHIISQPGIYQSAHANPYCPSCNGVIPHSPEMPFKTENGVWNFNDFHYPLQRDSSIGGFTLNGQPRAAKNSKLSECCSSHKIALVVSTFSLLVTIGLVIALFLMKERGMMDPM